jgi:hypothetical protein
VLRIKTPKLLLVSAFLLTGCSASAYRRDADRQVNRILRDRAEPTLGYQTEISAPVELDPKPSKTAYSKVPATPKVPPTTAPIEPSDDVPFVYGPIGPQMLFPKGVSLPTDETYGLENARKRAAERLAMGPPPPQRMETERLDLFGSLRYAVLHSRDYKARMEDLYLAALDVTLQRHLFEPRPFARTGLRYAGGQENADYAAALTATNTIGIRQQLPNGGEVAAQATVDFVRAISGNATNAEPASVALTASLPLLRGAGLINLESLIQSERTMVYEIRTFEDFRRSFAVNIASRYFRLLESQQSITNSSTNLATFQQLTARTQAMYAAGRLNYIEVQRVLQDQLRAESDLITAQASFRAALDDFKLVLGLPVDQNLEVVGQELAVTVPNMPESEVAELARQYRLDLRTAQDQVEDAQRRVGTAKNGLLPDLDLSARGQVGNNDDDPAVAFNNNTTGYSAGIDLDLPIDRVAERNAYRASLIRLERSQRAYDQLRDQVGADARDALRSIRSAQLRLEIERKGIEVARLRLDNASELLRQGRAGSRELVEAQNSLLRAQNSFENARATLQIQVLGFLRDTGTLRLDPDAGAIGAALNRKAIAVNEPPAGQ